MQYSELMTGTRFEVVWQPAEPAFHTKDSVQRPAIYISQLLETAQNERLLIAVPIKGFRLVNWPSGSLLDISFVQSGDCAWSFSARIVNRLEKDQIAAFLIQAESPLSRLQRRAWYRLDCTLDMTYKILTEDQAEETASHEMYPAITRNISGGGAAFVANRAMDKSQVIEISIALDESHFIKARGKIRRMVLLEDKSKTRYQISIQFTEISRVDQDSLIRYIFRRQMFQTRQKFEN